MMRRAPVHHVADNAACTCALCGGWCGEHRYTMWRTMRRAPVHYVVDGVASTGTLCMGALPGSAAAMGMWRSSVESATPRTRRSSITRP
jgi:hypothetical protein